jgi:hypothetical protein
LSSKVFCAKKAKKNLRLNKGFCASGVDGKTISGLSIFNGCSGRTSNADQQFLSSTNNFKSAAVPGRRNSISPPDTKPFTLIAMPAAAQNQASVHVNFSVTAALNLFSTLI